ncbi:hypothetical protein VNO77_18538 [Canavalia gladiata]|uniref:Uncharacterized protein n=1 Tax=Canavalia gladiata TaxID=3824 RepID=A0AAN9LLQ0_CANGL
MHLRFQKSRLRRDDLGVVCLGLFTTTTPIGTCITTLRRPIEKVLDLTLRFAREHQCSLQSWPEIHLVRILKPRASERSLPLFFAFLISSNYVAKISRRKLISPSHASCLFPLGLS